MQPCPKTLETFIKPNEEPYWRKDETCSYCGSQKPESKGVSDGTSKG